MSEVYVVCHDDEREPVGAFTNKEDASRAVNERGGPKKGWGYWPTKLDPPFPQTWKVLIEFTQDKVTYLVHIPTEEQTRGYHKDKLYPGTLGWGSKGSHLQLITDTVTADEAKDKARELLLKYIEGEENSA